MTESTAFVLVISSAVTLYVKFSLEIFLLSSPYSLDWMLLTGLLLYPNTKFMTGARAGSSAQTSLLVSESIKQIQTLLLLSYVPYPTSIHALIKSCSEIMLPN